MSDTSESVLSFKTGTDSYFSLDTLTSDEVSNSDYIVEKCKRTSWIW